MEKRKCWCEQEAPLTWLLPPAAAPPEAQTCEGEQELGSNNLFSH